MNFGKRIPFALHWMPYGIPVPEAEYRFHPERKWRFDYAWPDKLVALEIEGGAWTQGRHFRGAGAKSDMEKYNEAAMMGWRVLRVTPDDATSARCAGMLVRALNYNGGER